MSRRSWLLGHLTVTVLGSVVLLAATGLGMGLAFAAFTGDHTAMWRFPLVVLSFLPGVLMLGAVTYLLYGFAIRWAWLAWLLLVFCVVALLFGQLLRFPAWLQNLSPFTHFALVPAEPMAWGPFVVVLVLAAVTATAGVVGFLRRDLH